MARPAHARVVNRRAFIVGVVAPLVAPRVTLAQSPRRIPSIGWLTNSVVHGPNVEAFRDGMRALGYPEIRLEVRAAAGQVDRLSALVADLLARGVEIIVTDGGPAAAAAKHATTTTPIVIGAATTEFVLRQKLIDSLSRPGANVTGFTISTGVELYGKRLQLLHEALPDLGRVVIVWNPSNEGARTSLRAVETEARALGVQTQTIEASSIEELDRRLGRVARDSAAAMLTIADAFLWSQRTRIIALASRYRLPGMYPEREFAMDGGLMAYGSSVAENFRRAAGYVDRILKGARPADLPVEQPTRFDLVINLRTASTLGLTIPRSLLLRADHIID